MDTNKSPELNKFINLTWQMDLDFWWVPQRGNFYICIVQYLHDIYNAEISFIQCSQPDLSSRPCNLLTKIINSIQIWFNVILLGGAQGCESEGIDKLQKSNAFWPHIIVSDFWWERILLPNDYRDIYDLFLQHIRWNLEIFHRVG